MELDLGAEQAVPAPLQLQTGCAAPPCGDAFDGVQLPGHTEGGGGLGALDFRIGLFTALSPSLSLGVLADLRAGLGFASAAGPFASPIHPGVSYRGQTGLGSLWQPFGLGLPLQLRWSFDRLYTVYGELNPEMQAFVGPNLQASNGQVASLTSPLTSSSFDLLARVGFERKLDFGRYGVGLCAEADVAGLLRGLLFTVSYHFDHDTPFQQLP